MKKQCKCGCGKNVKNNIIGNKVFYSNACRNKFHQSKNLIRLSQIKEWAYKIVAGKMSVLNLNRIGLPIYQKKRVMKYVQIMTVGKRSYNKL